MGDYRPISLITSLYKIILKMLSNWLRGVMGMLVSSTKSVFIHGRKILDNIIIANECLDLKRSKKENGVVCKLDMEKAYNRVDWDFLFWVLQSTSFWEKWISLMQGCVVDTCFSILINGTSKGFFKPLEVLDKEIPFFSLLLRMD